MPCTISTGEIFWSVSTISIAVLTPIEQHRKMIMKITSHSARLVLILALLLLGLLVVAPTQAAPATLGNSPIDTTKCRDHKLIPYWGSRSFIEAQGFNFDIVGAQASVKFQRDLSLDLSSN